MHSSAHIGIASFSIVAVDQNLGRIVIVAAQCEELNLAYRGFTIAYCEIRRSYCTHRHVQPSVSFVKRCMFRISRLLRGHCRASDVSLSNGKKHSPDGTALFTVAQLTAHHNDELSHSSPQQGGRKISKGRKVNAERFIKGATPSRRKQMPAAKEDNAGLLNEAGGSVGSETLDLSVLKASDLIN